MDSEVSSPEPRTAVVYCREGTYFVRAHLITDDFEVEAGVVSIPARADGDEELGVAVQDALAQYKLRVGGISDDEIAQFLNELLTSANVRSFSQFARSASAIEVEEDGGVLRVIPMLNGDPNGGFESRRDAAVEVRDPSPVRLGAIVRDQLSYEQRQG
jgi:hypothetical protein